MLRKRGMYQDVSCEKVKDYFIFLSCVAIFALQLTACTAVQYQKPELQLNLKYQDVSGTQIHSALRANSYALDSSGEEVTPEELPKTLTRDFAGSQYCYVISVVGGGTESIYRDRKVSCENSFPGFGLVSKPFEWEQIVQEIPAVLGAVRFDVMGIKKSFFGSKCPAALSFQANADKQLVMNFDGKSTLLAKGIESLNPVFLSKAQFAIQPGKNSVELKLLTTGKNPVGKLYGCQEFKMFPDLNSDETLRTGMRKMFFKVDCPQDAEYVVVENSYAAALSEKAYCDVKGQAFVKLVEPTQDELMASEYGWYLPSYSINAFIGDSKISQIPFKMKYSRSGRYASLKDQAATQELSIPLEEGDSEFQIASVGATEIKVLIKNSENSMTSEFQIPVETGNEKALAWNGLESGAVNLGALALPNPLQVVGEGFLAQLSSSALGIYKCSASTGCESHFQGVALNRAPSSVSRMDFSIQNHLRKMVALHVSTGSIAGEVFDLNKQPWVNNDFGSAQSKESDLKFFPEWQGHKLQFVRALNFEAEREGLRSAFRDNWVAGGSMLDPYSGLPRAVLYRSPDGGRNWYRVYLGQMGSELVDAQNADLRFRYGSSPSFQQASFVVLERKWEYDVGGHELNNGELRVLVQDHHGF